MHGKPEKHETKKGILGGGVTRSDGMVGGGVVDVVLAPMYLVVPEIRVKLYSLQMNNGKHNREGKGVGEMGGERLECH